MSKLNAKNITKGVDSVSVNILDNGYTLEFSGYNSTGDWVTSKVIVSTIDELCSHMKEITGIPHD